MRVLVTGIEGFVGGHLADLLAARGHEVWGTMLDAEPGDGSPHGIRCDVRDPRQVRHALAESGAEAVVHLAARASVADSQADPAATYVTNVVGSLNVLEAARLAGLTGPLLLIGSAEAYGDPKARVPVAEDVPLRPLSSYAGSKAAQEVLGAQYARSFGLRVVLTRSFSHTGPGQDTRFVFPSFARQLIRIERDGGRGTLRVGNISPVRDYLDVRDVAAAYALLLEQGEAGSVYNVCRGRGFALSDYLDELIEIAGVEVQVVEDSALVREVEVPFLVGDPGRLAALGWRPEVTTRDMLAALLSYWRERE